MEKTGFIPQFASATLSVDDDDPELLKVVAIPDALSKAVAHMGLHELDLHKAAKYLDELDKRGYMNGDTVAEALWYSALVALFKCFGNSNARIRLDPTVIYTDDHQLQQFKYWKSMRNKYLVHDDNDGMQSHVFALLRRPDYRPSIAKVEVLTLDGVTIYKDNAAVVRELVNTAREWVQAESIRLSSLMSAALNNMTFEELDALPPVRISHTNHETVHRTRTSS
ncbi:hypothetical protein JF710_22785 [Mycobacterium intracellulare]|uniref:hypothetical protein n=1 Tax=Mycobacterium intracellulare TaxID=1767 RepID=UPI001CDB1F19|nr:hypothetical protein [Mycobacterium intracellulare]MCA2256011.1 hypothetical protein [Mycobacterium intracellulare]